jgi:ATP-binding protein involved in chromosome partitioning
MEQTAEQREQDKRLAANLGRIKHTVIVLSGKGGVGKTTVAVNLACGLAAAGHSVGIMDIDLHGPNIAKMLGVEGERVVSGAEGLEPFPVLPNLKAMSIALLIEDPDSPIIWRGPMKMGAIKQFLSDVNWGELDYLVIDSPPGTGDEPLSACQLIPNVTGAVIVTTPQDVAVLDARKTIMFARQLHTPVIGVIENMSGFICPHCGNVTNLFGAGGGERTASDFKVPFLGKIPFEPEMVLQGDAGRPFTHYKKATASADAMNAIIEKIILFWNDERSR